MHAVLSSYVPNVKLLSQDNLPTIQRAGEPRHCLLDLLFGGVGPYVPKCKATLPEYESNMINLIPLETCQSVKSQHFSCN